MGSKGAKGRRGVKEDSWKAGEEGLIGGEGEQSIVKGRRQEGVRKEG